MFVILIAANGLFWEQKWTDNLMVSAIYLVCYFQSPLRILLYQQWVLIYGCDIYQNVRSSRIIIKKLMVSWRSYRAACD